MSKIQKILLILTITLLVFVGAASLYISWSQKKCSIEITSNEDTSIIKVVEQNVWNSFLSKFTECRNGKHTVYDRKSQVYLVKNILYMLVDDNQDLVSLRNVKTDRIYFRWNIEIDPLKSTAKVYLYIPDQNSDDYNKRLFSAIYYTSKILFKNDGRYTNSNLDNYTNLAEIGLSYEN